MRRTKQWWANLSPEERSELVRLERMAQERVYTSYLDARVRRRRRINALIAKANGEGDAS